MEPAVDGSEEAKQVDLFLESEHAAMQKAFDDDLDDPSSKASPPPQVEVNSNFAIIFLFLTITAFSTIGDLLNNSRRHKTSTSFFSTHP